MSGDFWKTKRLDQMTRTEWEALCDGCGKCCLHKLEDEDTGAVQPTNVACKLLDRETARCTDYKRRRIKVPDCLRLTARNMQDFPWLPRTCAYRLLARGEKLPHWHYLVSGDREAVHRAGESVRGWTISELDAGDLEHHCVERDL
ncbi:MAG: YcgN family cysteine cluster protein [Pseudomonadota bacterium]